MNNQFYLNVCNKRILSQSKLNFFGLFMLVVVVAVWQAATQYETVIDTIMDEGKHKMSKLERCRQIFEVKETKSSASSDEVLTSAMEDIAASKGLKKFVRYLAYFALSTFIPSLVKKDENFNDTDHNNSRVKESRLDKMNWKIPFLPCQLRDYSADDVNLCVEKREMKRKTFRVAFMGDSRVRQLMEYLIVHLQQLNFTMTLSDGTKINVDKFIEKNHQISWPKLKENLMFHSSVYTNVQIRYFWAPYLGKGDFGGDRPKHIQYLKKKVFSYSLKKCKNDEEIRNMRLHRQNWHTHSNCMEPPDDMNIGIMDELQRLLKKSKEELPDIIIIDSAMWDLMNSKEGILLNLEKQAVQGFHELYKNLEELASRTTVIVFLPYPFKDYLTFIHKRSLDYFSLQKTNNLQWHLNAQFHLFPSNVLVWDSFIPFAYASIQDCFQIVFKKLNMTSLPSISRFEKYQSYGCLDYLHLGYEAIGVAVQMLLNYLCNREIDKRSAISYCCENIN